jgi:hypothetical protein
VSVATLVVAIVGWLSSRLEWKPGALHHGRGQWRGHATTRKHDIKITLDPVDQIGLGIELLQVDEGRPLVAFFRQQVELVELRGAVKDLADAPHHALVDHALADAEPVPIFQRAF